MTMRTLSSTSLGKRPVAVNNLNGESFQQDPLVTHNGKQPHWQEVLTSGWQYCAVYIDKTIGFRQVQLSRRRLPDGPWDSIVFEDYLQESDDGHNVICFGISHDDGSIHISWDLHSSQFNYRRSIKDLVSDPEHASWEVDSFGPVLHALPDLGLSLDEVIDLASA
jgi:hypothetical protein